MKNLLYTAILLITTFISYGQNPSMTISHAGISPSTTLTVNEGDSIDFFYGGGQSHPMTEGWQTGEFSTPITFVTQTVTSSNPSVTFLLDTPGTYYFHCGSNPGNSSNWGKITVLDTNATTVIENKIDAYKIYPNPVSDVIYIDGIEGEATIIDLNGKIVQIISEKKTNLSALPSGVYFIEIKGVRTKFIKK